MLKTSFTVINSIMIFLLVSVANVSLAAQQSHQAMQLSADKPLLCDKVTCAKTVTSAFAPNGDLWRVWALNQRIHYQISADNGVTFSTPNTITSVKEKVSARGESRPKIAFDRYQGVYISWAMPKEKKYTVLSISDNGLGIDLEKYGDKFFGMYKTFRDNPDSKGIGLYITKNQIEAMDGKVTVTSKVDVGTTFKIYFNDKN